MIPGGRQKNRRNKNARCEQMKLLIVGLGSMGKRRARLALSLIHI